MRRSYLAFTLVLAVPTPLPAAPRPPLTSAALDQARVAGRPVAVVVSRRACPRCAEVEQGCLADPLVTAVLEGRFSTLALDADERPDAAGGLADSLLILPDPRPAPDRGLPFIVLATTDLRPLDGTTLAPEGRPLPAPSLLGFLIRAADAWEADRDGLEVRAGLVLAGLREAQALGPPAPRLSPSLLDRPLRGLREAFDRRRGAFGLPPRRIPHGALLLLIEEYQRTADRAALGQATAVLDAVLASPLRGPGGGFYREALGEDWSRPVLEQTLADNALLLRALVAAHEATGTAAYAEAAVGVAGFLRNTLSDESSCFRQAVAPAGERGERDDRVFAYANGLAVGALARSGRVLGRPEDRQAAERAADAVLARLGPPARLARVAEGADRRGPALLDDHAYLAWGLLDLYQATGAVRWRDAARALVEAALVRYADPSGAGFYESAEDGEARPARRRDAFDGGLPSAQAVMVSSLQHLGRATGEKLYTDLARRAALAFAPGLGRAPRGLESFAAAVGELLADEGRASSSAGPGVRPANGPDLGSTATRGPLNLEAVVEPRSARAGSSATVSVRFRLAAGASLVAHRPLPEGGLRRDAANLLPLAVAFPGSSGLKLDPPDYPAGSPVVLTGSAAPILAHASAGEAPAAVVSARFTVPAGRAGDQRLRVRVSFQVCEARGCAAPDSALLEATFAVLP